MDTRIALIGVLLETRESVDKLNHLLSDYGEYVIGRMGLPYKEKGIHIISIAVDAPNNIISALSGKLGMLPGVSTKTIYGKISRAVFGIDRLGSQRLGSNCDNGSSGKRSADQ